MSEPADDVPVDPMDDDSLRKERPAPTEAVEAAERMNSADGDQPGVVVDAPPANDDDPLPDLPQ